MRYIGGGNHLIKRASRASARRRVDQYHIPIDEPEVQILFQAGLAVLPKQVKVDEMQGAAEANKVIRTSIRLYQEQENRLRGWG